MEDKKYYWIKLKDTFLTSDKVDFLMSQKNGANYVVLYQCLCLKCANTNGELVRSIGEVIIPFDENKIVRDCKWFDIDTVRVALMLYKQLGLIYVQENGTLRISHFDELVGSESKWAEYKRIERAKNNDIGQCPKNVQDNVQQEIRDKILDIRDIEKKDNNKYLLLSKEKNVFKKPTIEEIEAYVKEKNYSVNAEIFYNFYESKGWYIGKNKMKNWKSAVATWENKIKNERKTKTQECQLYQDDCNY